MPILSNVFFTSGLPVPVPGGLVPTLVFDHNVGTVAILKIDRARISCFVLRTSCTSAEDFVRDLIMLIIIAHDLLSNCILEIFVEMVNGRSWSVEIMILPYFGVVVVDVGGVRRLWWWC